MRILFLSHYFPPEGNAPATRTWEHCRRWVELGHEVTVVTCAPNVPDGVVYEGYRNRLRPQREVVDGIHVVRVWTYIAPNKGTILRIANFLSYMFSAIFFSFFLKRPDVVLATSPQFFNGWAGVWVGRLRRCPFILEIRDIWPESIVAVGAMSNRKIVRFLEWLERRMYRAARHIVTVGEGYRLKLLGKQVADARLSVVMNGIDGEVFAPCEADEELIETLGLKDKFVVSYIGTIGMACGLEVALDAASLAKERREDVVFLFVGDGASRQTLEDCAQARDLNNVVFAGRHPKEEMCRFLSVSNACLVHLKKTDLFTTVMPSKIFEAAAMEIPVINGVEGFAAEYVDKSRTGVNIPSEDSRALMDAIQHLRDNPGQAKSYGQAGRRYVLQHNDRQALADRYLEIIKEHLEERKM